MERKGMSPEHFTYNLEAIFGMLDKLPPGQMVEVTIPDRGKSTMTVERLREQLQGLKPHDIGPDAIAAIDIKVLD